MKAIGNEFQSYYGNLKLNKKHKYGVDKFMMDEHLKNIITNEIKEQTKEQGERVLKLMRDFSKINKFMSAMIKSVKSLESKKNTKKKSSIDEDDEIIENIDEDLDDF